MKTLWISTGLFALFFVLPSQAQASSYCGERICHSYDKNGACNNYTCLGDGYGGYGGYERYDWYGRYGGYGRYDYRGDTRCGSQRRGDNYARRSYSTCSNRYSTSRSYYYDRYPYYESQNQSQRRPYRQSYYRNDDYYDYGRYTDRIYAPKAGYYYRY